MNLSQSPKPNSDRRRLQVVPDNLHTPERGRTVPAVTLFTLTCGFTIEWFDKHVPHPPGGKTKNKFRSSHFSIGGALSNTGYIRCQLNIRVGRSTSNQPFQILDDRSATTLLSIVRSQKLHS